MLLDELSGDPFNGVSLNGIELAEGASMIDLVSIAVGNITTHEIGHYLGNWHTDNQFDNPGIMDQGGNLPQLIGLGPDGIFGSDDDPIVRFHQDFFTAFEGFVGVEDTISRTIWGLTTGTSDAPNALSAKKWTTSAGRFSNSAITRSPSPTPAPARRAASASACAATSP